MMPERPDIGIRRPIPPPLAYPRESRIEYLLGSNSSSKPLGSDGCHSMGKRHPPAVRSRADAIRYFSRHRQCRRGKRGETRDHAPQSPRAKRRIASALRLLGARVEQLLREGLQLTPTAMPRVSPIDRFSTRSATLSRPVGSRFTITKVAPLRLASAGNPAAG